MKPVVRIFAVVVALLLSAKIHAQIKTEIKCIIDSVIRKAKQTSLNAHEANWDSVRFHMYKDAKTAKSINDLKGSFEFLLNALDDRHGKFVDATTHSSIPTFTGKQYREPSLQVASDILIVGDNTFEFKVIEDGIGYLKIVSISLDADVQKEAEIIRSAIDSLKKGEPKKWIIDLRYLTSGNINPIIAGIAPLLGEGQVGGVVDGKSRIRKLYEIHNGNFYDDQQLIAKFPSTKPIHDSVAVLIGHHTAGPGEVVAITMKGRRNTKFFGEPTAGYLVAIASIQINNSLIMSISEGMYQDRIGNAYKNNLEPDKLIVFDPTIAYAKDKSLAEALEWLNVEQVRLTQLVDE